MASQPVNTEGNAVELKLLADNMTGANQQLRLRLLVTLVGVSFENEINIFALFKANLLALLIGGGVLDSNFLA